MRLKVNMSTGLSVVLALLCSACVNTPVIAPKRMADAPPAQLPGFTPAKPPAAPAAAERSLWGSKAEFLAAARKGDLSEMAQVTNFGDADFAPVLRSITHILRTDYKVPPLPRDAGCDLEYREGTKRFMRNVTLLHTTTLSEKAPTFFRESSAEPAVQESIRTMERGSGNCDMQVLGKRVRHPYAQALTSLMQEYGQATKEYVEAERTRRKTAYAKEQAQVAAEQRAKADAKAKRDAEEQERIDAERARVEAEQKRLRDQNKQRVGG